MLSAPTLSPQVFASRDGQPEWCDPARMETLLRTDRHAFYTTFQRVMLDSFAKVLEALDSSRQALVQAGVPEVTVGGALYRCRLNQALLKGVSAPAQQSAAIDYSIGRLYAYAHDVKQGIGLLDSLLELAPYLLGFPEKVQEIVPTFQIIKEGIINFLDTLPRVCSLDKLMSQQTITLSPQSLDIKLFLSDVVNSLPRKNNDSRKIISEFSGDFLQDSNIYLDPLQLTRLVDNLLSNAIKHAHPTFDIRLMVHRDQKMFTLKVSSIGTGIVSEKITKMLNGERVNAHKISSNGYESHGQGMANVRQIVQAHNGHWTIDSADGLQIETVFTVRLPIARRAAA